MDGELELKCGTVDYESEKLVYEIECDMATTDMIKIVLSSREMLTLCEVELYGETGELIKLDSKILPLLQ